MTTSVSDLIELSEVNKNIRVLEPDVNMHWVNILVP